MKNFKYIDKESPKAMTVGLFEFLNLDDAVEAIDEMTISLYNKKLDAKNFGELIYNDETSPKCYTQVISCVNCQSTCLAQLFTHKALLIVMLVIFKPKEK